MSLEKETPAAEPLKFRRRPQRETRNNHRGVFQWTGGVCVGDMRGSDDRISGETCSGERNSTGGTTPVKEKANRAGAGVGGLGSSDDLWEKITQGERSETTCSVAAKSGKGRGDGLQGLPTPSKVRELQITLYRKAKAEKTYRFWSLYGEVQRTDVLETAWRKVAANGGAAGVDGETIKQIRATPESERAWLERLQGELKTKTYRPQAVRRVMIPKANGGQRPLGIPTVKDRVVQMAVYLVLMPIYEADFHPRSYGFRPQRNAHQAVEAIREALRMGKVEVVDADLAQYFDTIPHRRLLRQVARRIRDGSILKLIRSWLRAPVVEESETGSRRVNRCERGTPQGGVISPLLANLYLHPLDEAVNEGCRLKPRMIRYADDLVILCRPGEGKGLHERLARWLTASGLRLNEAKTRVINSRDEGFEFLGFTFRWQRSSKGTAYVHTEASVASQQRLRDRVREITRRELTWKATEPVVEEVNEVTRGWKNYFAHGHHGKVFGHANHFIGNRLRQWLWRKHGNPCGKYQRWPDRILAQQYGLYRL
jgi:RNA-directed DNA polymerase